MIALVHVPYWWHATLLELLWLAGGLAALPLAHSNLRDAVKDEAILDELRHDPAIHSRHYYMIEEAAKGRSFEHWLTVISSSLIVIAGIVGCSVPNPQGGYTNATGLAVTVCLVGISLVTAVRTYMALVRRQRLYDLAAGRSAVLAAEMRARNTTPSE